MPPFTSIIPCLLAIHCCKPQGCKVRQNPQHMRSKAEMRKPSDKLTQTLRFLHDSVQTLKVGWVIVWLCGVVQQGPHRLNLSYCIVTLLLSRGCWRADIYQVVDTVSHRPEIEISELLWLICPCILNPGTRQRWVISSWTKCFAPKPQNRAKMHTEQRTGLPQRVWAIRWYKFVLCARNWNKVFRLSSPHSRHFTEWAT
jgi:hypothetical protein